MARITITEPVVLTEPRRVQLNTINPGKAVRIDNPQGVMSFYIINKIPQSEDLNLKKSTVALTNLGSGRIVQKRDTMLVVPISADILIREYPHTEGNINAD